MTLKDRLFPAERPGRRQILSALRGGVAAAWGGSLLSSSAQAAPAELNGLPGQARVWRDVLYMNSLGPRYVGEDAHRTFTEFLQRRLAEAGCTVEPLDRAATLWRPTNFGLKTTSGAAIRVASICRGSATTGPEGVTAPLKFLGRNDTGSPWRRSIFRPEMAKIEIPADVAGKIALIEIMSERLPYGQMFGPHLTSVSDPTHAGGLPDLQSTAAGWATNENTLPRTFEADLRAAGAVGVIYAWANGVDDDASGQYRRTGTKHLPSLWVGLLAAKALRDLADQGASVTMTVEAQITDRAPTKTIIATLPGQTDETILLWTHIDGMNAVQENGSVAVINLMKYFADLPKSARKRTITVVMSEGHMELHDGWPDMWWWEKRPDLLAKAVAALAPEHLGCLEWISNPSDNSYAPAGRPDITWAFTQSAPAGPNPLAPLMTEALKGSRRARTMVIDRADAAFSIGLELARKKQIPTIAYITTPAYFLAEGPNGHLDKLDPDLYYDQFKTLARLIRLLDATPKATLRPS